MGQQHRVISLISATVMTASMIWIGVSYSALTRAQETQADTTTEATIDTPTPDFSADPSLAITTTDPSIEVEDLQLLVKPLTLEQLHHEAAGWLQLLQTKVQQVSDVEIVIKRENRAMEAREAAIQKVEAAKASLEAAEAAQSEAEPGTPDYEKFAQQIAEAQQGLREAEAAIEAAIEASAQTGEAATADSTFQAALAEAQQEQSIARIKEFLESAREFLVQLPIESSYYPIVAEKVNQLDDAIRALEMAQEKLDAIAPDSPDYEIALGELNQQRELSRTIALELITLAPELADEEIIAAIKISEEEASDGAAESVDEALEDTTSVVEDIGDQIISGDIDAAITQDVEQQLEESQASLEETAEQEAELRNQLVVNVTELQAEQFALIDRFEAILDELDAKGGDSSASRKYIQAVSGIEIDLTDTEGLGVRLMSWVKSEEGGIRWGRKLILFVLVFVACILLSYVLSLMLKSALKRFTDSSSTLQELAIMVVRRGGLVLGILIALTTLDISLTPLLALLGGASFVLAFALQSNLSNVASGLMMMWRKPFDIGDYVTVADVTGFVREITLLNTIICSKSYDTYVMPNELIWSSVIMNSTTEGKILREVHVQVGFEVDIERVEALLLEIATSHPRVLETPKPETLVSFAEFFVVVQLRPSMMPADYDLVPSDLRRMITERFQQEGIAIAIPPY